TVLQEGPPQSEPDIGKVRSQLKSAPILLDRTIQRPRGAIIVTEVGMCICESVRDDRGESALVRRTKLGGPRHGLLCFLLATQMIEHDRMVEIGLDVMRVDAQRSLEGDCSVL